MTNILPRRFYIDCTNTYFDGMNDGISRVTRALIEQGPISCREEWGTVHPVVFCEYRYYLLPGCDIFKNNLFTKSKTVGRVRKSGAWYWKSLLSRISPTQNQRRAYRRQLKPPAATPLEKLKAIFPSSLKLLNETLLTENDFLVLPEIYARNRFPHLLSLKKRLRLACVIHDLIPLTHPEYCADSIRFNEFFKFTAKMADVVVAVSRYSAECYTAYERLLQLAGESLGPKKLAWFHPGCDLDCDPTPPPPTSKLTEIFADGVPVYLVCGTIEPRKNHLAVLQVFHKLWASSHSVKLLFVGRYGWMAEETLRQIDQHPELNKRLFWLSQCSDADLRHAYSRCRAVIFASHAEGFGLPLVEALAAGCQVFFSRIKPFEEIIPVGMSTNSFDPNRPEELLSLVLNNLSICGPAKPGKFKVVTWQEAIEQFYRILADLTISGPVAETPPALI